MIWSPRNLRRVEDLAQTPHESSVHPHQLLVAHQVGLVQHDADLVLVSPHGLDTALELIRYVQLVRVEEEQDDVHPLREPLHHAGEVVPSVQPLLLAAEDARGVDQRDARQHVRRTRG